MSTRHGKVSDLRGLCEDASTALHTYPHLTSLSREQVQSTDQLDAGKVLIEGFEASYFGDFDLLMI